MKKIYIFDTTLRDGEQSAGVVFTKEEKLEITKILEAMNVDIIEAGFAAASKAEFETIKEISKVIKNSCICSLARLKKDDIDKAYESIKQAEAARIHVFIATSDIHLKEKLKLKREEVLEITKEMLKYAKEKCSDIEFSPEDATRTQRDFLYKVIKTAIEAGATVINIPDTVGFSTPQEFGELIKGIKENVEGIEKVKISVHCHDDLGLAVANTLSGVMGGAQQVEVTINGIGERAGNAALEEVVMAIKTRRDIFKDYFCDLKTQYIMEASNLVANLTGMEVAPNKAIVGRNAFLHQSGVHQDGMLKSPLTYQIIDPKDIGLKESKIILGKLSGKHAFKKKLQELGYELSERELDELFWKFKDLATKKKRIYDSDIVAFVEEKRPFFIKERIKLERLQVYCGKEMIPTATVMLNIDGKLVQKTCNGDGPIDAIFSAISKILEKKFQLLEFSLRSLSQGSEALGEGFVRIRYKNKISCARAVDTDIIIASTKAFINAINKII